MTIKSFSALLHDIKQARMLDDWSIHGPKHWARAERNGRYCARQSGGNEILVTLFALFHDAMRENDGVDPEHGQRGGELAEAMNGQHFQLNADDLQRLMYACEHHTFGMCADDPTIGSCWDGDRLDLTRIGAIPDAKYMSTAAGKQLAATGDMQPVHSIPLRDLLT